VNLRLLRRWFTLDSTIGELTIDGEDECFILEDTVRDGPKIPGRTAIPEGTYRVIITHSPRFRRKLPLLLDVPRYEGIRIHPGNTSSDTEGCLLPGQTRGVDWVGRSRIAFDALFAKLKDAQSRGEDIQLTITSEINHG